MEAPAAVPDPQGTVRLPSMLPSLQSPLSLSQLLTEEALQAALEGLPVDIVNKHASEGEDGGSNSQPLHDEPHELPTDQAGREGEGGRDQSGGNPPKKSKSSSKSSASKRVFPGSAALKVLQEVAPREKLPSNAYKATAANVANLEGYIAAELARQQNVGEITVQASPFAQFANQPLDDNEEDTEEDDDPPLAAQEGWQQMLGAMQQHAAHVAPANPAVVWDSSTSGASSAAAAALPHNSPGLAALSPLIDHGAPLLHHHHDGSPLLHRGALRKRLKRRGKELLREAQLVAAQLEALNELEAAESGFVPGMQHGALPLAGHAITGTPVLMPHAGMMMGQPHMMPGGHMGDMHGRY